MPQPKRPARIVKWKGKFHLFWTDYTSGKKKRTLCESLGARNKEQRKALEQEYRSRELSEAAEVQRRGGHLAYNTLISTAFDAYLNHLDKRVAVREANPESREGLTRGSANDSKETIRRFKTWIQRSHKKLTTGDLGAPILEDFFLHLAREKTSHGKKVVLRTASTINKHKRNIKAALNHLFTKRPPLFPDPMIFKQALKPSRVQSPMPTVFTPNDLQSFLETALKHELEDRKVEVKRRKNNKLETFHQTARSTSATPVSHLFLLLAVVGCRLGEALTLRWETCDLDRGRITIHASKTGKWRILPLVGAAEGEVSPLFLELLRKWREEDKQREYVLPHNGLDAPKFPKKEWEKVNKKSEAPKIGPQMLRQNFCAYAASFGVPASVAALWQGHSSNVAERWYRAQVLDRQKGVSVEEIMGLSTLIEGMHGSGS